MIQELFTLLFADGKGLRLVVKGGFVRPFSISIFEDHLFWTDSSGHLVYRASKFDGGGLSSLVGKGKSASGILLIHESLQPGGKIILLYICINIC